MVDDKIIQEIKDLHRFFVLWFNGQIPKTRENFVRLEEVFADDFVLLPPNGERKTRNQVIEEIYSAYGVHEKDSNPFQISIKNITVKPFSREYFLVIYEEWQEIKAQLSGRISTALLHKNQALPNGVEWIYVHETWLSDLE